VKDSPVSEADAGDRIQAWNSQRELLRGNALARFCLVTQGCPTMQKWMRGDCGRLVDGDDYCLSQAQILTQSKVLELESE